jgi:hypothetical protein
MTQIEKTKPGAMVQFDYGDDAGRGYENQSKADTSIPFIALLQGLSPLVKDGKGRPGDFYNTVTQQVWKRETGLLFVPGTTKQMFGRWVPRTQGGGFRGHAQVDDKDVQDAIKNSTKFGKYRVSEKDDDGKVVDIDLVETFYVYGAVCDEDGHAESMAIIPFWSTKIRPYRGWMTRLRTFNQQHGGRIPLYANLTRLTSYEDKKPKGEFYVPVLSSGDPRGLMESLLSPDDERFQMAKACAMLVSSGDAEINYGASRAAEGDDEGDDDGIPKGPDGKNLF